MDPFLTAKCKGVHFSLFSRFGLAPLSSSICAIFADSSGSLIKLENIKCKGVFPSALGLFT